MFNTEVILDGVPVYWHTVLFGIIWLSFLVGVCAMPLFSLGRLLMTPAAQNLLEAQDLDPLLFAIRHGKGEWGDLSEADKVENELSVKEGFRILSAYITPMGKIYVITEADRSHTTIMLPSEY